MRKLTALTALLALLCSCQRGSYIEIRGYAQGGTYTVKIGMDGVKEKPSDIKEHIDSLLNEIDCTMSGYNVASMLSRFNRGEQIEPNDMFREIYSMSRDIYFTSGGAVDVASGPLYDAWGFGFSKDSLPDDATVRTLMRNCGMALLPETADSLHADGVKKLNFNAIAQGYSCDVVAGYLYGIGVRNMLVDIGEIFCDGVNPSGKGWTIAVDTPEDGNEVPGSSTSAMWRSSGDPRGVVTSGNYRKFYLSDGRKFAHTIDPRTGYPVSHNLLSATIIAPTAALADAVATWCMVEGPDRARSIISGRDDLEGLLIWDDGGLMQIWKSEGF